MKDMEKRDRQGRGEFPEGKRYRNVMEEVQMRESLYAQTKEKMMQQMTGGADRRGEKQDHQTKYRISRRAALIAAVLLAVTVVLPMTCYAVGLKTSLIRQIFLEDKQASSIIKENVQYSGESMVIGKYRFGIEEYLYDDQMRMGYLIYYMERADGEPFEKDMTEYFLKVSVDVFGKVHNKDIGEKYLEQLQYSEKLVFGKSREERMMWAEYGTSPVEEKTDESDNRIYRKMQFHFSEDVKPQKDSLIAFFGKKFSIEDIGEGISLEEFDRENGIPIPAESSMDCFCWEADSPKSVVGKIGVSPLGMQIDLNATQDKIPEGLRENEMREISENIVLCFRDGTEKSLKEMDLGYHDGSGSFADVRSYATLEDMDKNKTYRIRIAFAKPIQVKELKSVSLAGEKYHGQ